MFLISLSWNNNNIDLGWSWSWSDGSWISNYLCNQCLYRVREIGLSCKKWPAKFWTDTRSVFCNGKSMRTGIYFTRNTKSVCNFVNPAYNHLSCELDSSSWWGVLDTTLCDKVCQWLVSGQWFSQCTTPISSTNKIDRHNITEILLKGMLNTITLTLNIDSCTFIFNQSASSFF